MSDVPTSTPPEDPTTPPPEASRPPMPDTSIIVPGPSPMDPLVPLVVGLFLGGIAYFLYGQWQKAIVALAVTISMVVLTCGLLSFLVWVIHLVVMFDAYFQAKHLKEGRAIRQWTFFDKTA